VILSTAAGRENGAILPLPSSIKLNKGAAALVLKGLLRHGLIAERPAAPDDEAWRESKDRQRLALAITEAGLTVIGAEAPKPTKVAPARASSTKAPKSSGAKAKTSSPKKTSAKLVPGGKEQSGRPTKQGLLLELLRRKNGATIEEMVKATDWQPHSIRGAISGLIKKKLGLPVTSDSVAGRGRVYRIPAR
jgi:hypothetical protein